MNQWKDAQKAYMKKGYCEFSAELGSGKNSYFRKEDPPAWYLEFLRKKEDAGTDEYVSEEEKSPYGTYGPFVNNELVELEIEKALEPKERTYTVGDKIAVGEKGYTIINAGIGFGSNKILLIDEDDWLLENFAWLVGDINAISRPELDMYTKEGLK